MKYKIGQRVWIKHDIFEGADDHSPAGWIAYKGDQLEIVRKGLCEPFVHVRHPNGLVPKDSYFVVKESELMDQTPLVTIIEQQDYIKRHGHKRGGFEPFNGRLQCRKH